MKTKYLKVAALLAAVVFGMSGWVASTTQAQEKPAAAQVSTNWIGGLVVGKKEIGDPIAGRGLFPRVEEEIEIGLRSDGVVVWRRARQ